jgi:hypothetical protein
MTTTVESATRSRAQPGRSARVLARLERWGLTKAPQLDVRRVAIGVGACIAVLGVLGALRIEMEDSSLGPILERFDIDGEYEVPAAFSGCLLFGAAAFAYLFCALERDSGRRPGAIWFLPPFLLYMGIDEIVAIHERLQMWTGINWQELYLPVAAAGGVAWLAARGRLRRFDLAPVLLVGGAAAWLTAQVFEHFQYEPSQTSYVAQTGLVLPEEMLEMAGSTLFALAFLVAVQALLRRRTGPR